jgi:hypothetical protein
MPLATHRVRVATFNGSSANSPETDDNSCSGTPKRPKPMQSRFRPIVIAHPVGAPRAGDQMLLPGGCLLPMARSVDKFAEVDFTRKMTKSDLNVLKDVPEATIKTAFAEIVGEPDVPKDWGGEQFDLWTTKLFVEGQPLRAAVLFKGPAEFKLMTIASLGKNGDQIDRLASSAPDVLVIHHCHSIIAPVVNMARVYAKDPRHPRRYIIIDD